MFNFELLTNKRAVVHCPNRDDAIAFVKAYRERFPGKYFIGCPGDDEYWSIYRENTCYIPNLNVNDSIKYVDYQVYKSRDYVMLEISDIMQCADFGDFARSSVGIKSLFGME